MSKTKKNRRSYVKPYRVSYTKKTIKGPYTCKTHIIKYNNSPNNKYTSTTTKCICNGMDCLSNPKNIFTNMFGGNMLSSNVDLVDVPLQEYEPEYPTDIVLFPSPETTTFPLDDKNTTATETVLLKSKKKSTPISDDACIKLSKKDVVKIDISKITNKHCREFDTSSTKYMYCDQVNLNTLYKEKRHPSGYYKDVPCNQLPSFYFNVHLGQRKLMLSEMQVLLKYYEINPEKHPVVLYIGSAPGIHLLTLSNMFPNVKFILYDGAKIYTPLKKHPKFEVHDSTTGVPKKENDGFFTTEKCNKIVKKLDIDSLIFICDIRLSEEEFEKGVIRDMELQKTWMIILKPFLSLVKFRLPYGESITELSYFKGEIFYGIWPPLLSTETRLMVYQKDIIENNTMLYNIDDYEGIMYYHNKYIRPRCQSIIPKIFSKYILAKNNIYCSCYDCISELNVLNKYSMMAEIPLDNTIKWFGIGINTNHKLGFNKGKLPYQCK